MYQHNPTYRLATVRGSSIAVGKIICVGRNYAEHVREMDGDPANKPPVFFFKPNSALNTTDTFTYPTFSRDVHHEIELVVALGKPGRRVSEAEAEKMIKGFAVGLDMTCRDLQQQAKADGGPWDLAKGFDESAPVSSLQLGSYADLKNLGDLRLTRNGEVVQQGRLADMIWSVPQLISQLSHRIQLQPGDLIFTGTPEGVGPVQVGDELEASLEGLEPRLRLTVAADL